MSISLNEFIEDASYCFVKKSSMLASMLKTGEPNHANLIVELNILGMYFYVLRRIGMDYALTESEVTDIMNSILSICRRSDLELPNAAEAISGGIIGDVVIGGTTTDIPPKIYPMNYSGVETFSVTVPHNLNKFSPTVIVTEIDGLLRSRVYPSITEDSANQLTLEFVSTSAGIITVL